jgi:hypothetical protein
MRYTRLKEFLETPRRELIRDLKDSCSIEGKKSWLFWPRQEQEYPPFCLVAHVDTVQEGKKDLIYDHDRQIFHNLSGTLGADDRAGCYLALKLYREKNVMALITDGEESGGQGAYEASNLFGGLLKEISFLVEIDRRGHGEAVFYNGESGPFKKFIKGFGFKEARGTFSDISILGPAIPLPSVNLSAGYYHEHTDKEYLEVRSLNYTALALERMVKHDYSQEESNKWIIAPSRPYYRYRDDYYSGSGKSKPPARSPGLQEDPFYYQEDYHQEGYFDEYDRWTPEGPAHEQQAHLAYWEEWESDRQKKAKDKINARRTKRNADQKERLRLLAPTGQKPPRKES